MIELKKKKRMSEGGGGGCKQKGTSWPIPTDGNGFGIKSPYYK